MNDQKAFFKPEGRNTLGGKALRRYTTGFTYTSFVGKRKIYKNKKQKTKNKKQKTKHKTKIYKNKKQKAKNKTKIDKNKKQNKTKYSLLSYLVLKVIFLHIQTCTQSLQHVED